MIAAEHELQLARVVAPGGEQRVGGGLVGLVAAHRPADGPRSRSHCAGDGCRRNRCTSRWAASARSTSRCAGGQPREAEQREPRREVGEARVGAQRPARRAARARRGSGTGSRVAQPPPQLGLPAGALARRPPLEHLGPVERVAVEQPGDVADAREAPPAPRLVGRVAEVVGEPAPATARAATRRRSPAAARRPARAATGPRRGRSPTPAPPRRPAAARAAGSRRSRTRRRARPGATPEPGRHPLAQPALHPARGHGDDLARERIRQRIGEQRGQRRDERVRAFGSMDVQHLAATVGRRTDDDACTAIMKDIDAAWRTRCAARPPRQLPAGGRPGAAAPARRDELLGDLGARGARPGGALHADRAGPARARRVGHAARRLLARRARQRRPRRPHRARDRARDRRRPLARRRDRDAVRLPVPGALRAAGARLQRRPGPRGPPPAARGGAPGRRLRPPRAHLGRAARAWAAASAGCCGACRLAAGEDLQVLAQGFASLDNAGSRQAFLHTVRAVIEPERPARQRPRPARPRRAAPVADRVGREGLDHPGRARRGRPRGDARQPLRGLPRTPVTCPTTPTRSASPRC